MDAKERVETMEIIFSRQLELTRQLRTVLDELEADQANYEALLAYYQSSTYMDDLGLDAQGTFDGMRRGVLSEDGVYNLIFERGSLAERLADTIGLLEK